MQNCRTGSGTTTTTTTTTTYLKSSAPHNKCTALKCTAFEYTNGSFRF